MIKLSYKNSGINSDDWWKQSAQDSIDYDKKMLNSNEANIDKNNLKAQIEVHQFALENNISYIQTGGGYSATQWKINMLNLLITELTKLNTLKTQNTPNEEIIKLQNQINDHYDVIKNNDFDKYYDIAKEKYNLLYQNGNITAEQKDIFIQILDLDKKYGVSKNYKTDDTSGKQNLLSDIKSAKQNLLNGININTQKQLTLKERQQLNDKITIDLYKLDHNISEDVTTTKNFRSTYENIQEQIGIAAIFIFMIIVAGSTMSTEYSKGTIKSLVMVPCKRWKILLSKLLIYILYTIILTVLMSILTLIISKIFFGSFKVSPYLYISNGEVVALGHVKYMLLRFLSYDIDIIMYVIFAIMLSVITKNTAASVAIPMFLYAGNTVIMTIINMNIFQEWIKFIPFNNMNLTNKVFKLAESGNSLGTLAYNSNFLVSNLTIKFSLLVLLVYTVVMIVTMFDSFTKKDIIT